MTHDELSTLLQRFLENTETSFVARIDDIITSVESKIYGAVRTPDQRKSATGSFTIGVNTVTIASPLVEPLQFYLTAGNTTLLPKSSSFIKAIYGSTSGTPAYFSLAGADQTNTTVLVGPTPSAGLAYQFDYYGIPNSLTDQSSTWLSVAFPDALLYGCLVEGAIYDKSEVRDGGMLQSYKAEYERAIAAMMRSSEVLALTDEYRGGIVRSEAA